jgi:aspartate/methionine/tyrosine aminotransferase
MAFLPSAESLLSASVRSNIPPFHAMAMNLLAERRAGAGLDVLHLEVGQPSTPAPSGVLAAAHRALDHSTLGYTNAPGLAALRARISHHYADWYGVEIDPGRILISTGASGGFTLAFLAAFDAGDRVGVIEPGYPCYRNTLLALGCEPVPIAVGPDTRWAPTPELIEAAGPLKGLVLASPSNPTGTALTSVAMAAIAEHAQEHGIRLVVDEIYHGITFGMRCDSMLEHDPSAIVVNSFSKYFSMTGWRLGWIVVPDDLTGPVERFQQNLYICAPALSQIAAIAAFYCHDELRANVEQYEINRRLLLDGLASAGFEQLAEADGAFYVYADVRHLVGPGRAADSLGLCHQWLDELGVTATPGIDFDLARGDRFVRFSYAGRPADIAAACTRLVEWNDRRG